MRDLEADGVDPSRIHSETFGPPPRGVRLDRGRAEVLLDVAESFHHAAGSVHGAWYFKLLDDAAFFAVSSLVTDVFVVTASFTVELMRPVVAGRLRAVGHVSKPGRTLLFAASELYDDHARLVAKGTGTFARSAVRLADVEGYPTE